MVLFFGLVFSVTSPGNFSADAFGSDSRTRPFLSNLLLQLPQRVFLALTRLITVEKGQRSEKSSFFGQNMHECQRAYFYTYVHSKKFIRK